MLAVQVIAIYENSNIIRYDYITTFAAAGPCLWNSLPTPFHRLHLTLDTFRHKLKTHLTVRSTSA